MQRSSLAGRSILVVEDQPLVALDITQQFEVAGAALTTTNTLHHALILVEHDGLAGAILDHALGDGDSSLLCTRLKERGVPFMIYSGYDTVEGPCKVALHISKPAADGALVAAMEGLLMSDAISKIEIGPLHVEQRGIAHEYRALEKVLQGLHKSLSTKSFDRAARAETEAGIVTRTAELMRVGRRLLDVNASVNVASVRSSS
jgi:DNA-binding response OmpR family regulator